MTVQELIAKLQQCDPTDIVVLSRDSEGNGYSTAYSIAPMMFNEGEVRYRELTPALIEQGYEEEDVSTEGTPCVVLWP